MPGERPVLSDEPSGGGAPETKICPDCAEQVLAAARKCRFCGYRFDRPPPGAAQSLLERLGLWRRQPPATFDEILADWGVAIHEGERTACFRIVSVDGRRGYLLVTDARLVFIRDGRRTQTLMFEHCSGGLEAIEVREREHQIVVRGMGFQHVIQTGSRRITEELADALRGLSAPPP